MGYQLLVPPAAEVVALADAKIFMRVDFTDDDALITSLVAAARDWCETYTEKFFVTQTWRVYFDAFPGYINGRGQGRSLNQVPAGGWFLMGAQWAFAVPFPPCQSVVQVQYIDANGITQTLTPNVSFVADTVSQPARVYPVYGTFWPVSQFAPNAAWCDFVCGFGRPVDVPDMIQIAIKQLASYWYENRGAGGDVPDVVKRLLYPYRDLRF